MRTQFPEDIRRDTLSKALRTNDLAALKEVTNALTSRMDFANKLGQSYDGDRKLYAALGYPHTLTFNRFWGRYRRQDVAKRVVDSYPNATWRGRPEIVESEDSEVSPFEHKTKRLFKNKRVYNYFTRADKLARIGKYAVIVLGFDDGREIDQPVVSAKELKWMQVYKECDAEISMFEEDPNNERFGKPTEYRIKVTIGKGDRTSSSRTTTVHWQRIIHIPSDNFLDNEIYGSSALECIYNRLQDIELISGGSAEMFWRGAFPGMAMTTKDDFAMSAEVEDGLEEEIDKYTHNLSRVLKLQGIDVTELKSQIASPKSHIEIQISLISAGTGIPQRLLTGSERGELASTQDTSNWEERVGERRIDYAEPVIIKQFVDRMITVGILPIPADDEVTEGSQDYNYSVVWTPLQVQDEEKKASVAKKQTEALALYVDHDVSTIIPEQDYLTDFVGVSEEKAISYLENVADVLDDEDKDLITEKLLTDAEDEPQAPRRTK